MTKRLAWGLALIGTLAGCNASTGRAPAPVQSPPQDPRDRECWATQITPAEYQYVMGQVQVVQARRAADGTIIAPPIYRNQPVPKQVKPREELRFRAPCPEQLTPEFIATLQRALFARGYFAGIITGRMDDPTRDAIRAFQKRQGLDSGTLSLETAQSLGVLAIDLPDEG